MQQRKNIVNDDDDVQRKVKMIYDAVHRNDEQGGWVFCRSMNPLQTLYTRGAGRSRR